MLYKGTFKDINDKQYTVRITTNGDTSRVTTLTLGTPPFTTSMDSDGDSRQEHVVSTPSRVRG